MDLTQWMEQWNMFPPAGGAIVCAVSGGRDSLCLLHYLRELSTHRPFTVAAAHVNHGMRPTAERDEAFVRQFCLRYDIPLYVERVKVYECAAAWKLSVEETGRRLRYDFLERLAAQIGAQRIATAHHLGDQAETVLLHLLRGTGLQGLAGIPPVRGKFIRPLLQTPREEIEAYLSALGQTYVEDETNDDLHYARNRLRKVIWPELMKLHGGARENIARTAQIARQESAYLNELASQYLPQSGEAIDCNRLMQAPPVLRRRALLLFLERQGCGRKDLGQSHIEALERLCAGGGMANLPDGAVAVCRGGQMRFARWQNKQEEQTITPGEAVVWGNYILELTRCGDAGDAETLIVREGDTVSVRSWRSGDGLTLRGGRGRRSLKRLMQDAGIPPEERADVPVLCVNGRLAAAVGIGVDTAFLLPRHDKALQMIIKERIDKRK